MPGAYLLMFRWTKTFRFCSHRFTTIHISPLLSYLGHCVRKCHEFALRRHLSANLMVVRISKSTESRWGLLLESCSPTPTWRDWRGRHQLPGRATPHFQTLRGRYPSPCWGGVFEHPLCGFSRIARKRRRAAPPDFHLPYPLYFCQLLWKFRSWVMEGQVTRSGQVTIPYKNFTIAPQLQCLRESYETFGIW